MGLEIQSAENPFRDKIIELLEENSQETTPSIHDLAEQSAGRKFTLEEAAEYFYEENTGYVLMEEDDGELKGFFLLKENDEYFREKVPEYWPHLEIGFAFVKKDYRRKGIAEKLLEHTRTEVMDRLGHRNLIWVTSPENQASQNFAEENGFQEAKVITDDKGPGNHTIVYAMRTD